MEPIPENKESNVTMNINENNGNNLTNEDIQSMINILTNVNLSKIGKK